MRGLSIRTKTLGPEHPLTAWAAAGMAWIRERQKNVTDSEQFARRAIATLESVKGPSHHDLATPLTTLARALAQQNKVIAAHPDVAESREALARLK